MRVALALAFVSLLTAPLCHAADNDAPLLAQDSRVVEAITAFEHWLEYQSAVDAVPAVSYGLVHDQELLASGAFGFADPETGERASADTLFSICSISKLFTSIAVLQQRDAGKLRLDDPVADHLSWFDVEDVHPDDGPITVRGLLTHSAGLPRESAHGYWTGDGFPFPTREEIRERLGSQKTLYPASRYHQYSNLGLTLAGEIAAATAGQDYAELVRTAILDPLGMDSTYTEVPVELRGERLAVGYSAKQRDGSRRPVAPFQTRGIAPAAGFASNVSDLAKFAMWQFRLLGGGDEEVLRASTLREMHRVHWVDPDWSTTWGLGFVVERSDDRTYASHGGGCPGYITSFRIEPKTKLGAIVLTSAIGSSASSYGLRGLELVGPAVAAALDGEDTAAEAPDLERYTGIYGSIWGEVAILRWRGSLAALQLGSGNPKQALFELEPAGEHSFRRVRRDDGSPGEEVFFELGENGTASRYRTHNNWYVRSRR